MHSPSELILIHDFNEDELNKIVQFSGIQSDCIHYIDKNSAKAEKCKSQRYMKETIGMIYTEDTYGLYNEFTEYVVSTQSMCYLFDFIQEHNPKLVCKIQLPLFNNTTTGVILANHTLSQLNIISDNSLSGNSFGKLSSVSSFLNKCVTPMGKRLMQYQITHPTTVVEWLKKEYEMIHVMTSVKTNYAKIKDSSMKINKIKDIDKVLRQLVVKTLYPSSIYTLFDSLHIFHQLMDSMLPLENMFKYL